MSAPQEPAAPRASASGTGRRVAAAVALGGLIFLLLWLTAFSVLTSLLISMACCVVVTAASSVSDIVETILDATATVVFGIFAVIAAIFAAIFGLFGF